ncbi:hypothetical protein HW532_15515 [Kaustia mangrovi]|uniref:Uncharacterized protein n=1 Tax=Kaustia mangrovi TaxID=2593653 RepID=A0A7S8C5Y0_9HYPH|nr:hypothetical protein [Kaustia mangrovi]QPC43974.1 hypothetical protein HW532_15515 [Kaustia mangrovi]
MSHLETFLLIAMGFALASLIAVFVLRAVWNHGERVGRRRVQKQIPTLDAELQADRTRLRAEIAMARRKAEYQVKEFRTQLAEKSSQLTIYKTRLDELTGDLAERDDEIAKMRTGRVPLEAELEDRANALQKSRRIARDLNDQIQRLKRELEAARAELRQRDRLIQDLKEAQAVGDEASEAGVTAAPAAELATQPPAATGAAPDAETAQARLRERIRMISALSHEIAAQREALHGDEGTPAGTTTAGDSTPPGKDDAPADSASKVVRLSPKDHGLAADLDEARRSAEQLRADLDRLDEIWHARMSKAGRDDEDPPADTSPATAGKTGKTAPDAPTADNKGDEDTTSADAPSEVRSGDDTKAANAAPGARRTTEASESSADAPAQQADTATGRAAKRARKTKPAGNASPRKPSRRQKTPAAKDAKVANTAKPAPAGSGQPAGDKPASAATGPDGDKNAAPTGKPKALQGETSQ